MCVGLGGTCVNVGCIPKKLMHQTALLREFCANINTWYMTVDSLTSSLLTHDTWQSTRSRPVYWRMIRDTVDSAHVQFIDAWYMTQSTLLTSSLLTLVHWSVCGFVRTSRVVWVATEVAVSRMWELSVCVCVGRALDDAREYGWEFSDQGISHWHTHETSSTITTHLFCRVFIPCFLRRICVIAQKASWCGRWDVMMSTPNRRNKEQTHRDVDVDMIQCHRHVLCLCLWVSRCLYVIVSICHCLCLYVIVCVYMSLSVSVWCCSDTQLGSYEASHPGTCCVSVCLSVCPSLCLSLSVRLSVCLCVLHRVCMCEGSHWFIELQPQSTAEICVSDIHQLVRWVHWTSQDQGQHNPTLSLPRYCCNPPHCQCL